VKEKFGGLRFNVNNANDAIRQRIEVAELESLRTCEVCASVVTSKAAMRGQGKTGHARKPSRTSLFYTASA
jgi:hypothetical protein